MNKIYDLLKNKKSVIAFDVDGVLAVIKFGERNHFVTDEEWENITKNNINTYTEDIISNKMKDFISTRNMDNIYVITKVNNENEYNQKVDFCSKFYNIKRENVFYVKREEEKAGVLQKIKENYKELPDENIIMVDDTTDVLTDVMEKTSFSTAHISLFLDI